MSPEQFEMIVRQRFARLNPSTVAALRTVVVDGMRARTAEDVFGLPHNTVSRYAVKMQAELKYCEEVCGYERT